MSSVGPTLRFSEFSNPWREVPFSQLLQRASNPVDVEPDVEYREIGVRSHGRGLFHKDPVSSKELGNKRVFHVVPDALVLNIVFAWEQAVALTSENERGFIASHRFPMFLENDGQSYLPFIKQLLLTPRGKLLLEIASPGGAGRNKTLGQDAFLKLRPVVPEREEQKKVATFFDAMTRKITLLTEKRTALEDYKRGVIQRLFSGALRFTQDDGTPFPDWEERKIGDVLTPSRITGSRGDTARKISVQLWARGVRETERTGSTSTQYYVRKAHQFIYSKLDFLNCAFGIVPDELDGLESTVDLPAFDVSEDIEPQFLLNYVIRREFYEKYGSTADGSRKARRIQEDVFMSFPILMPHPDEQRKIADFLSAIHAKIDAVSTQISEMETFKKGLLQKMFV